MKSKLLSGTGLVIIVAIVLAVNLFGVLLFRRAKLDLTEEKLYTLSKGTTKIIKSIPDTVRAEYFYSKTAATNLPPLKNYGDRVLQILREYQDVSGGKIKLEVLDPRPDTEIEEEAESNGLQGVAPEGAPERIFMGLVLKDENDNKQMIAFFDPRREDSLEYDISKALYNVTHPERKKIGVLSSINVMGDSPNPMMMMQQQQPTSKPWAFIRELRNNFVVNKIEANATEIPKDIDLLLVIHPKNVSDATQYAIEQYVLAGGKAAVFVDPFSEADKRSVPADNMQMQMQASYASDMPKLLKAWGVELKTIENANPMMGMMGGESGGPAPGIVQDPSMAVKVNDPRGGTPMDMIVWLSITEKQRNAKEVVTSQLENMLMAASGALKKTGTSNNITITPLVSTSDKAGLAGDMMLKFGPNPEQLLRDYKPGGAKLDLAVKITGKFRTAFPEGKPAAPPTEEDKEKKEPAGPSRDPNQLKESKQPTTIIVVADADVLSDYFSVQTQNFFGQEMTMALNDNLSFGYNIAENLTGSQDLIELRSRGKSNRPFVKVEEIRLAAQDEWREQERELEQKFNSANQRLTELQQGKENERRVLDEAYMKEVEELRAEKLTTQRELRKVKLALREDIEHLEARVMFVNIALMPLIVAFCGILVALKKSFFRREA